MQCATQPLVVNRDRRHLCHSRVRHRAGLHCCARLRDPQGNCRPIATATIALAAASLTLTATIATTTLALATLIFERVVVDQLRRELLQAHPRRCMRRQP